MLYCLVMVWLYYNKNESINADNATVLSGFFAPISAVGTIIVAILLQKISKDENRADSDLKLIINTYYRIVETYGILIKERKSTDDFGKLKFYERQIEVDCILMDSLIKRYPSKKYDITIIQKNLKAIYLHMYDQKYYDELATHLQIFCRELNPNWEYDRFTIK